AEVAAFVVAQHVGNFLQGIFPRVEVVERQRLAGLLRQRGEGRVFFLKAALEAAGTHVEVGRHVGLSQDAPISIGEQVTVDPASERGLFLERLYFFQERLLQLEVPGQDGYIPGRGVQE